MKPGIWEQQPALASRPRINPVVPPDGNTKIDRQIVRRSAQPSLKIRRLTGRPFCTNVLQRLYPALFVIVVSLLMGIPWPAPRPSSASSWRPTARTIADQDGDYADWLELYQSRARPGKPDRLVPYKQGKQADEVADPGGDACRPAATSSYSAPRKTTRTRPSRWPRASTSRHREDTWPLSSPTERRSRAPIPTSPSTPTSPTAFRSRQARRSSPRPATSRRRPPGAANGNDTNILLTDTVTISTPSGRLHRHHLGRH